MFLAEILSDIQFATPNFASEWNEAQRYPELKKLGQYGWAELAQRGRQITIPLSDVAKIGNTTAQTPEQAAQELNTLDAQKVQRVRKAATRGTIEMPIVVMIEGKLDLLSGNTRFTWLVSNNIPPTVWMISV